MRHRHRLSLVVLAVLPAIVGVHVALGFRGRTVYTPAFVCMGHQVRPDRVYIACGDGNFYATDLRSRWRAYGSRVATANGRLVGNDCRPDCARGHFHSFPGRIMLSRIVKCADGRLYYSHVAWRFTGRRPTGSRSGGESIGPYKRGDLERLRCHRVDRRRHPRVPVLGSRKFALPFSRGWGHAHPSLLVVGGTARGILDHVRWRHWGAPSVFGSGRGLVDGPTHPFVATVELWARHLGHCSRGGPLAYTQLLARAPNRPGGPLGRWFHYAGSRTICG